MRRGRKRRKNKLIRFAAIPALLAFLFFCVWLYVDSLTYKVCSVEAGQSVAPGDFFKNPKTKAVFTAKSQEVDTSKPGEYVVLVKSGLFTHKCRLRVQDTVAPKALVMAKTVAYGQTCEAKDFIGGVEDATEVTASFQTAPNFNQMGEQSVTILLTDMGGNQTALETVLLVSPVVASLDWEVGRAAPKASDFVVTGATAQLLTTEIDTTKLARYEVSLSVDGEVYYSVLNMVDTTAPVVKVKNVSGCTGIPVDAVNFIQSVQDATEVTAGYVEEPDFSSAGTRQVQLVFTDAGGNKTYESAELTLSTDTEPPVIVGAVDSVYVMGTTMSYRKNITVIDNSGENIQVNVDNSKVNLAEAGEYPVIYSATDSAGNTTSVTVMLTVLPMTYDVNEVYGYADAVLASILKDDMSDYDKLRAIYNYVKGNVGYISHSDKGDWVKAAYEGLVKKQGDCFVYASTTKVLLDRAGITNMDIAKIPASTSHYWNLVDIGDGWYHMDTTPRKDHPTIFYWTDEQLMEYSEKHNKSHNYDHDVYPKVN